MDEKFIELKIITKEGIMYDGSISFITVPSIAGEITILPNHIPLLSGLKNGVIKIGSGSEKLINIASGFIRFINNQCVLTIEESVIERAS